MPAIILALSAFVAPLLGVFVPLGIAPLMALAARRTMPGRRHSLAFFYVGAAMTVAMLSLGTWQTWWLSVLWLGAALLTCLGASAQPASR